ncbi:lysozyme family protein [Anaerovorax odorimutans]|uniref:Lysozyme family protein n=1 Tax=Anaerovorax odorimutans TaxID=109327 RepID=A0ABT1RTK7_9FIRM|nr:lysozyme family protein [Anaerovorax odorimutans]
MGREIKVKEIVKDIKVMDKAAAVAQHMKPVYVRTKEYAEPERRETQRSSPVEYAQGAIVSTADQATHKAISQANRQGGKVLERIRKRDKTVKEQVVDGRTDNPAAGAAFTPADSGNMPLTEKKGAPFDYEKAARVRKKSHLNRSGNSGQADRAAMTGKSVAGAGIKTARQAERRELEIQSGIKVSRRQAKRAYQIARHTARQGKPLTKRTKAIARKTLKTLAQATKALVLAAASGGGVVILILVMIILFGGILYTVGGDNASAVSSVSPEVEAYEPLIQKYAAQHGIPEYVELIKAVMMQESGGRGSDPMQAAECGYNKKYPHTPNGIPDPEYSINVGIENLAACLKDAGAKNPMDMDSIKTALQGYNYGNGYISWAKKRDGHYTAENAVAFSEMMAKKLGWKSYGDKEYVPHVLRYYAFGRVPTGAGDQAIVQIALKQEGNVGGQPYWSWYGFHSRVAWCACFVSWCANQCGYIESGIFPKFASCMNGAAWFREHGQWKDRSYMPKAGDVIFFNWNGDQKIDHVGIVVNTSKGKVSTIEGNSRNMCRKKSYDLGSSWIVGYGVPKY